MDAAADAQARRLRALAAWLRAAQRGQDGTGTCLDDWATDPDAEARLLGHVVLLVSGHDGLEDTADADDHDGLRPLLLMAWPAAAAAADGAAAGPRTVRIGDVTVTVQLPEIVEFVPRLVQQIYDDSQVRPAGLGLGWADGA